MSDTRYAAEIRIDVSDLANADEIDAIRERIEEAIHAWKPWITVDTREYPTA